MREMTINFSLSFSLLRGKERAKKDTSYIQKLLVETNLALPLRGLIEVPKAKHHRYLSESALHAFWRAVDKAGRASVYDGGNQAVDR